MIQEFEFMIVRSDDRLSTAELQGRLESASVWDASIRLQIVKPELDVRPVDPTVLSAIAAGSAAIGALFGALGGIAQSLGKQKITIQWQDGTSVNVEGRNAEEIVRKIVPLLESKPGSRIVITV